MASYNPTRPQNDLKTSRNRRAMNICLYRVVVIVCLTNGFSALCDVSTARADPPPAIDADGVTQIVPLGDTPGFEGSVTAVHGDGTVGLTNTSFFPDALVEGLYVFVCARKSSDEKRRFDPLGAGRCEISDIGDSGLTIILFGAAREKLQAGDVILMTRPPAFTTARLKAIPDWAPLVEQLIEPGSSISDPGARAVAEYRLMRIGRAIADYAEQHRVLPPAATAGPDGKPWHSWRVLILPQLGESSLYDRYRFDQPWNGPENKKLLAEMPDAYRDPAYGSQVGEFTHFAACVGEQAALVSKPLKADADGRPDRDAPGHRTWRDFKDGPTFCIVAGSVADGRIPWTKPDDVLLADDLPPPGGEIQEQATNRRNAFSAPHEGIVDGRRIRGGAFLFAAPAGGIPDVVTISVDADARRFRAALDIRDGVSPSRPDSLLPELPTGGVWESRPTLVFSVKEGKVGALLRRPGS
jgi:hypothetical protein